jgi:hypothetical protein
MDIPEKKKKRNEFMMILYDLTDGNTKKEIMLQAINEKLKVSEEDLVNIAQYLEDVEFIKLNINVRIALKGVEYVENIYSSESNSPVAW